MLHGLNPGSTPLEKAAYSSNLHYVVLEKIGDVEIANFEKPTQNYSGHDLDGSLTADYVARTILHMPNLENAGVIATYCQSDVKIFSIQSAVENNVVQETIVTHVKTSLLELHSKIGIDENISLLGFVPVYASRALKGFLPLLKINNDAPYIEMNHYNEDTLQTSLLSIQMVKDFLLGDNQEALLETLGKPQK